MDKGVIIAIIFGGAQVIASIIIAVSTHEANKCSRLKDDVLRLSKTIEHHNKKIIRYAKQIFFLRFVEESVYAELAKTNTDNSTHVIKRKIHQLIAKELAINYDSMDDEIKKTIEIGRPVEPLDISEYIK